MILHWHVFGLVAILCPIFFSKMLDMCFKDKIDSDEQKTRIKYTKFRYTFVFWLIDLFYMSIFNDLFWWKYVFGIVLAIISYSGIVEVLIKGVQIFNRLLPYELITATGIVVYLIYIIPIDSLRNIITAVIAALYGGVTTLIGVAWTVRHTNKERKEIERNSIKPIVYSISNANNRDNTRETDILFVIDKQGKERLCLGVIQNSDNGIFIIKEVDINGKKCSLHWPVILDKNMSGQVVLLVSEKINISTFIVIGTDIRGNKVQYELHLSQEKQDIEYVTEVNH